MKHTIHKASEHHRLAEIGHTVSEHTAEAGQKIRDEFDDMAPKLAAAAAKAAQTVAHTAAEHSRPVRAEAASRGSAALSGLLGAVTPEQIERVSRRDAKRARTSRSRGKLALLLAAAGGAVAWALWWKRSEPKLDIWTQEAEKPSEADRAPAEVRGGPQAP